MSKVRYFAGAAEELPQVKIQVFFDYQTLLCPLPVVAVSTVTANNYSLLSIRSLHNFPDPLSSL